jgi:arsenite methyltransferase
MGKEFSGLRSSYFKEIMFEFPKAREEELDLALHYLQPQVGESILETGAGSGFFTEAIAQHISPSILVASDPSAEQLEALRYLKRDNISIVEGGADTLPLKHPLLRSCCFDAIWSGGSFHHVRNKAIAFDHFYALLKPGGRLVISDVFAGSDLAKHFDLEVAKYCVTGHEVSFLSKEFTDSLCHLSGFQKPEFHDALITWKFARKEDIGHFLYKIHAMIKTTPESCLKNAERILGIKYKNGFYHLNWPLTVAISYKL